MLHRLVDNGNTVLLIEHHLDLIKNADWIIDLGPFAGDEGGELVAVGTPEFIASVDDSFTGNYLRDLSGIVPDEDAPGSDEFQQNGNGRHDAVLKNGTVEIKISDILSDQDMATARSKVSQNGTSRGRRRRRRRAASRSS